MYENTISFLEVRKGSWYKEHNLELSTAQSNPRHFMQKEIPRYFYLQNRYFA